MFEKIIKVSFVFLWAVAGYPASMLCLIYSYRTYENMMNYSGLYNPVGHPTNQAVVLGLLAYAIALLISAGFIAYWTWDVWKVIAKSWRQAKTQSILRQLEERAERRERELEPWQNDLYFG